MGNLTAERIAELRRRFEEQPRKPFVIMHSEDVVALLDAAEQALPPDLSISAAYAKALRDLAAEREEVARLRTNQAALSKDITELLAIVKAERAKLSASDALLRRWEEAFPHLTGALTLATRAHLGTDRMPMDGDRAKLAAWAETVQEPRGLLAGGSPVASGGGGAACESCGGKGTRSYDMAGMRINGAVCKVCNGTGKASSDPAVCTLCGELLVAGKCITDGCKAAPAPSGGERCGGCDFDCPHEREAEVKRLRAFAQDAIDLSTMYPEDVFPEPTGPHGSQSRDRCSAAALRAVLGPLAERARAALDGGGE